MVTTGNRAENSQIMFFLGKIPQPIEQLLERLQTLSEKLMLSFDEDCISHDFTPQSSILDTFGAEQLGCIRSGSISIVSKGIEVGCLEVGDLVGIGRVFGLPHMEFYAQEDVKVDLIQRDQFVAYINSDPMRQHRWSNYLLTSSVIFQQMLSHFHVRVQVQTPKGFQQVPKGDVIIHEGDYADTVYQLMAGSADVTVNEVTVGEVLNGEIFGAMAVFTGEQRNATVTAREDCQLLAIPKVQFVELIRAQPETAMTLLDNMSRRIKSLNEQVIKQVPQSA